jgi:hypothetical protein
MRASYTLVALVTLASAVPLLLDAATASAHFGLTKPASTKPADVSGKGAPPCGPDTTSAGTPAAVQGGHDMDINLDESNTPHPGFYRVALSLHPLSEIYVNGKAEQGKFFPVDNVVKDKDGNILPPEKSSPAQSAIAIFQDGRQYPVTGIVPKPVFPVVADNLFAHTAATPMKWVGTVKLPNVSCDRCTLQVIEFMAGHGWNDPGGFFYHHCAELKITADPALPLDPAAGGGGGTGGTGGSGGNSAGGAGAGGMGVTTAGTAGAIPTGGTAGATTGGATTAGTPGTAGAPGTAGTPGAAGTAAGTAGTGTATTTDDSSCGIAKRSQGAASALAALGLLFALGRRRRTR